MKYGEATMGQFEAVINRLGGMVGLDKFLAYEVVLKATTLLQFLCASGVSVFTKFVASEKFTKDNPEVRFAGFNENFVNNFLGKIEENIQARTINSHRLKSSSRDPEMMVAIGPENRIIKLAHLYEMLVAQGQRQNGPLATFHSNIAYVQDANGVVWAVIAGWDIQNSKGWFVNAKHLDTYATWSYDSHVLGYEPTGKEGIRPWVASS